MTSPSTFFCSAADYQKTFANYPFTYLNVLGTLVGARRSRESRITILRDFEGLLRSGEMLLMLGQPRSGCSTLLKTLAGQMHGLYVDKKAKINYQGGMFTHLSPRRGYTLAALRLR